MNHFLPCLELFISRLNYIQNVQKEVAHYINSLHHDGGYILMASQNFEGDVPIENIEAVYSADRRPSV